MNIFKKSKLFIALLVMMFAVTGCRASDLAVGVKTGENAKENADVSINENYSAGALEDGLLKVTFIDVGQGDSILIVTPNNKVMLIDAGEKENSSKIKKVLNDYGITKIDAVVATHPHSDHIGGLAEIINSYEIGTIYMPKVSHTSQTYENLLLSIKNKGLTINSAKAGVIFDLDEDVSIDFVAPNADSYSGLNNYSAVIKLVYKENSFLFTGDCESVSEKEILEAGYEIYADVLKIAHHGSDTSNTEDFIKTVDPYYAVIQSGKGNSYGHPTDVVIERLADLGACVLRNDELSDITFKCDGQEITVDCKKNLDTLNEVLKNLKTDKTKTEEGIVLSENIIVYVTSTGKKYHLDGCTSLNKSKIEITLDEAVLKYTPCNKCSPPS